MEKGFITLEKANQYELLRPLLTAIYDELQELSKRKPESPLTKLKVTMVNRILQPIKELLVSEIVVNYLDILDSDVLPTNSDVVLILSQYNKAMVMFHDKYYKANERKWLIK